MSPFQCAFSRIELANHTVVDEVVVARLTGETQLLELRVSSQLIEEGILVDRWERAIVAVDGCFEHAERCCGLAAVSEVASEHVVNFGIVINFYF